MKETLNQVKDWFTDGGYKWTGAIPGALVGGMFAHGMTGSFMGGGGLLTTIVSVPFMAVGAMLGAVGGSKLMELGVNRGRAWLGGDDNESQPEQAQGQTRVRARQTETAAATPSTPAHRAAVEAAAPAAAQRVSYRAEQDVAGASSYSEMLTDAGAVPLIRTVYEPGTEAYSLPGDGGMGTAIIREQGRYI